MSTSNDSPISTPIQPLHNPSQAAQVVVPQAPLGNVPNQVPGTGAKALLAKKMAKIQCASFLSTYILAADHACQQPYLYISHRQSHDPLHSEAKRCEEEALS